MTPGRKPREGLSLGTFARPLSCEEIDAAGRAFKERLHREAARQARRHNSSAVVSAIEAVDYIEQFVDDLKARAESRLQMPRRSRPIHIGIFDARDAAWTVLVLGIRDRILTPEEGAEWLEQDRIQRAKNVTDASRCKGQPKHY